MFGTLSTRLALAGVRSTRVLQKRNAAVICGPPTVHVSKAEEVILGSVMAACFLATPVWVLLHIKVYRAPKE